MANSFTFCCIVIPILLSLILAIFNSNNEYVNELLVDRILSRFETGVLCMRLEEENNVIIGYGELPNNIKQGSILTSDKCSNIITVHNKAALYSGFLRGTIGIGETYFRKEWSFDSSKYDLGDIITHIFWNVLNTAGPYTGYATYLSKFEWMEYLYRLGLTKDKSQDMEDVCHAYFDHRFFEKMLDSTMQYTCSLYNYSINTLYDAQINKDDVLLHKLNLFHHLEDKKTINVLDVGSGWGFLADYINKKGSQFNVTGITISRDQYEYSINKYGTTPTFYLMDFRDLPSVYPSGFFQRIVSVGVISHIHSKRLDEWFKILYDMLQHDGYFVMQGIVGTAAFANGNKAWLDIRYACNTNNFVYKYIFPGLCLLLSDWIHESAIKAGFIVMHRGFIGHHYAKTLREWRHNIVNNKNYLLDQGIVKEKKFLSYEMYLAQSEASFRTGRIDKTQFVFYKPRKDNIHKYKFEEYGDRIHLSWQGFRYAD